MADNRLAAFAFIVPVAAAIMYLVKVALLNGIQRRAVKSGEYVSATVEVWPCCGSEDGMSSAKMWALFVVSLLVPVAVGALVVLLLFAARGWVNGIVFTAAYWEQAGKIGVIYGCGVLTAINMIFHTR